MNDDLLMELADCGSPERLIAVALKHHSDWAPPVPLRDFATSVGIKAIEEFDADAFEGALMTDDAKVTGVILHRPRPEARQRFTIAHELGHFLIISHRGNKQCTAGNLRERDTKDPARRIEAEANRFAAGLLMPKPWVERDETNQNVDLGRIRSLAERYGVSLEAAANRYIELSDFACAAVFWQEGKIRYTRCNTRFPYLSLKAGDALPAIALDQSRGPPGVTDWIERDGGHWIDGKRGLRVPSVLQQSLVQRNGFGITLLELQEGVDEDEIDEAAWAPPTFRR